MPDINQDRVTAYHEAGHAVAAWTFGMRFKRVTIVPKDDSLGSLTLSMWGTSVSPDLLSTDDAEDVEYIRRRIVVSLAGGLAEEVLTGAPNDTMRSHDLHSAVDLAGYVTRSLEDMEEYLDSASLSASEVVRGNWAVIEALAGALLEHRTLNFEQATAVMGGNHA
jgi:ATP-dependent Zn protease